MPALRTPDDMIKRFMASPVMKWDQPGAVDRCIAHVTAAMADAKVAPPEALIKNMCRAAADRHASGSFGQMMPRSS